MPRGKSPGQRPVPAQPPPAPAAFPGPRQQKGLRHLNVSLLGWKYGPKKTPNPTSKAPASGERRQYLVRRRPPVPPGKRSGRGGIALPGEAQGLPAAPPAPRPLPELPPPPPSANEGAVCAGAKAASSAGTSPGRARQPPWRGRSCALHPRPTTFFPL